MQLEDRELRSLRGGEASGPQGRLKLGARPATARLLLGLPHPEDEERVVTDRTVVAQLAEGRRTPAAHDQGVRTVIRLRELAHIAVEACNQHDRHTDNLLRCASMAHSLARPPTFQNSF